MGLLGGGQQAGPAPRGGPSHVTAWPFALHGPGRKLLISFHLAQARLSICVCLGKLWTGLAQTQGTWRQIGKMEKHKTKRDPVKQKNNVSQLQIVRKVHLGFGLAGSDGDPAPLQLQAMDRCPLLCPAVPAGSVALQLLGVPIHAALMVGKVFGGCVSGPEISRQPPIGVPPSLTCSHLRHVAAGPAALPHV